MSKRQIEQRWVRPEVDQRPPGYWKYSQLRAKHLLCARKKDLSELKALLKAHPDYLNGNFSHHRTLVWEAARAGNMAGVKYLVQRGAEVNRTSCYNSESHVQITPYCAAVFYKRPAVAEFLKAISAKPDIFRAAFLNDRTRVEKLLKDDPTLLNAEDPHDDIYFIPPISFALAGGHREMANFLLAKGARIDCYADQLIYLAAKQDRMDLLDLLFKNGVSACTTTVAAMVATSDIGVLRYLLEKGASANRINTDASSALITLCRADKGGNVEKIKLLLEFGADPRTRSKDGRTAIDYAKRAGFREIVAMLK